MAPINRRSCMEKSQEQQTSEGGAPSLDKSRFCLVKFISEPRTPVFVVPNVWIHFDVGETLCYWPIHARGKKLEDAVKSRTEPDFNSKAWKAKHIAIKYRNDTWEKCDAKLDSYVRDNDTSGIDTEVGLPDSDVDEHFHLAKRLKMDRTRKPSGFKDNDGTRGTDSESDSDISWDGDRSRNPLNAHEGASESHEIRSPAPNEKEAGTTTFSTRAPFQQQPHEEASGSHERSPKPNEKETVTTTFPRRVPLRQVGNSDCDSLDGCSTPGTNGSANDQTRSINEDGNAVSQMTNLDIAQNEACGKNAEKKKKKKKSSQEVFQEAVLRRLQQIEDGLKENTDSLNLMLQLQQDRSPDKVVDGFSFPIADPDKLRKLEEKLLLSKSDRETLGAYLKSKGKAGSTTAECCEIIMSSLMTTLCGFFVNFRGNKCKEGELIADDSKKIGMEKAMPTVVAVIEGTFRDLCSDDKPGVTPKGLAKAAVKWLSKRKERMEKKNVEIPPLPWVWNSSADV